MLVTTVYLKRNVINYHLQFVKFERALRPWVNKGLNMTFHFKIDKSIDTLKYHTPELS